MLKLNHSYAIDVCLDPAAMRTRLQQTLPGFADGRYTIDSLRIVSARRNASRRRNPNPLTLRYELDVRNTVTGSGDTREFYGKVYRDGASADAVHGTTALHLPQVDMLLWAWPADPGLPQLPLLLDPRQTQRWWGESAHEVSALRYEPEQRATLRYTRKTEDGAVRHLYAKTFRDDSGEAIYRRFAHFWNIARHDALAPTVAQPLGYRSETHSFWQAQATGEPLSQALAGAGGSARALWLAQRLAHAIAALHAAPAALAGPQCRDTGYWLNEIRRRRSKITRVSPELADRVARVADGIEQAAVLFPSYPLTLIHGDCHPDQMWLDGERIVLFDFDEFALGDPMEDLAAFITKLEAVMEAAAPAFIQQFLAAYGRIAAERFCPFRLQWHRAVQQFLQTSRAFVFQVSDWRAEVERRLAGVEALCAPAAMRAWQ